MTDITLEPHTIIGTARSAIQEAFDSTVPIVVNPAPEVETRIACVTLRWHGHVRGCWSGRGANWREAIRAAAFQALTDHRRRRITRRELADVHIEVWLQMSRDPVSSLTTAMLWGETGVSVECSGRSAFFLPAVPIERRINDPRDLTEKLFRKARLFSDDSRTNAQLYCTHWRHFAEGRLGLEPCELHALRPLPLNSPTLVALAETIGDHLSGLQRSDGGYLYALEPVINQIPELDEHPVRLIGCTLALARLAQSTMLHHARPRLLTAAKKGELWLDSNLGGPSQIGQWQGRSLGIIAMALLAYAAMPPSPRRLERIAQLRTIILAAQRPDGSFSSDLNPAAPPRKDFFGPPQAVLALAQDAAWSPENEPAINRAFQAAKEEAIAETSPFFLAWHAKAWCAVAGHVHNPEVARFADRMVDQLLVQQIDVNSEPAEWCGGFLVNEPPYDGRPPSFLAALFTEAVLASERMRCQAGDVDGAAARRKAADSGLNFLIRLVIEPRQAFFLRSSEVALGGVRRDLASFDLRCDYTMHLGTCLAAALDVTKPSLATQNF